MSDTANLLEALLKISDIAEGAIKKGDPGDGPAESAEYGVCTPKSLPKDLQVKAAATAKRINPVNAPALAFAAFDGATVVSEPLQIAVLTAKYWGPMNRRLTVSFMESTPADLRARIISHLNAWACGIQFSETGGTGNVRISRGTGGYWSYLGTDILHIATNRPTMNLESFTMNTPESEFKRVIRHEAGHTLGFPHEHMRKEIVARIDRKKAYDYFWRTQGWNQAMVDQQVLTPLADTSIFGTPADQTSIMCYQMPGEITKDGKPILGGPNVNPTDLGFAWSIYPKLPFTMSQAAEHGEAARASSNGDSEFVFEPAEIQ